MARGNTTETLTLTPAQIAAFERLYPGDLHRGYRCGLASEPLPHGASPAFEHGRQCGVADIREGKPGEWRMGESHAGPRPDDAAVGPRRARKPI